MPDEYTIREIADAMARLELLETTLEKYIAKDSMRDRDMNELLTAVKEIKTYSPPKQKLKTKSKPPNDKETKPLKLEEEEALILEDFAEAETPVSKQISKKTSTRR